MTKLNNVLFYYLDKNVSEDGQKCQVSLIVDKWFEVIHNLPTNESNATNFFKFVFALIAI